MRITFEPTNQKADATPETAYHKVEITTPHDDLDIDQLAVVLRRALIAWGYYEGTVDDLLGKE